MKIGLWSLEAVSGTRFSVISPVPGDANRVYDRITKALRRTYPDERLSTLVWGTNAWSTLRLRRVVVRKLTTEEAWGRR